MIPMLFNSSIFKFRFLAYGRDKSKLLALSAITAIVTLAVLQDLIHAQLNNYNFYLSESLVYKIPWLLLLPAIALLNHLYKKISTKLWDYGLIIPLLLILVLLHFMISSFLIVWVAQNVLDIPYKLGRVFEYLISRESYVLLVVYAVLFLRFRYSKKSKQSTQTPIAPQVDTLAVKHGSKTTLLDVDQIDWIQSNSPYVTLFSNGTKYLYSATLKQISKDLNNNDFVRIHRSCIVNVHKIKELYSRHNGDYDVQMQNGDLLRMSRNYRKSLKGKYL